MLILALDTCDARGGVALLRGESLLQIEPHATAEDYSSWLLPAVARVLTPAGLTLRHIELYAIAAGPGSFTGVRVGLTTIKAWSEVYGQRIASVSRLGGPRERERRLGSVCRRIHRRARRNQIFAALYRRQVGTLDRVDEEMVIAPDKFLEWCAAKAGSDSIDWVSTDPNCLAQTPQWSSRPRPQTKTYRKSPRFLPPASAKSVIASPAKTASPTPCLSMPTTFAAPTLNSSGRVRPSMPPERNATTAIAWKIRSFRPADVPAISEILRDSNQAAQWPSGKLRDPGRPARRHPSRVRSQNPSNRLSGRSPSR